MVKLTLFFRYLFLSGYSSGIHYWEVIFSDVDTDSENPSYVGVCTSNQPATGRIGGNRSNWGLCLSDGALYTWYRVIARGNIERFEKARVTVGLLLDMENCTLDFFVNTKHVLSHKCPEWKVKIVSICIDVKLHTIFPCASFWKRQSDVTINFDVNK